MNIHTSCTPPTKRPSSSVRATAILAALAVAACAPEPVGGPTIQADSGAAIPAHTGAGGGTGPGATRLDIDYQRFVLDNGLTLLVYSDHSTPTVFVGMWYGVGSKDEPTGKSGFAHLFEHLMFQGTTNRERRVLQAVPRRVAPPA